MVSAPRRHDSRIIGDQFFGSVPNRSTTIWLFLTIISLSPSSCSLDSVRVSKDGSDTDCPESAVCQTIARALQITSPHGTVVVGPGLYSGPGNCNIILARPVTLISSEGANKTVVDCEHLSRCLIIKTNATVDGFTFRSGFAASIVHCHKSTTVRDAPMRRPSRDGDSRVGENLDTVVARPVNSTAGPATGSGSFPNPSSFLALLDPEIKSHVRLQDAACSQLDAAIHGLVPDALRALTEAIARHQATQAQEPPSVDDLQVQTDDGDTPLDEAPARALSVAAQDAPNLYQRANKGPHWDIYEADLSAQGGGCILVAGDVDVRLQNAAIVDGVAPYGGGIALSMASVSLRNVSISGNQGQWGGGLLALHGSVQMHGSKFSNNSVTHKENVAGAAVALIEALVNVTETFISGNKGIACGGVARGGAMSVSGGLLTVASSSMSLNSLTGEVTYGGGIFSQNANISLSSSYVVSSSLMSATGAYGGGIYFVTFTSAFSSLSVFSSHLDSNDLSGDRVAGGGIGVYVITGSANASVFSSSVSSNFLRGATASGGGVVVAGASVSIQSSKVADNFISGVYETFGGGFNVINGTLEASSTRVINNVLSCSDDECLATGGGVWAAESAIIVSSTHVSNNSLLAYGSALGGGLFLVEFSSRLSVSSSHVRFNYVRGFQLSHGGGIYAGQSTSGSVYLSSSDLSSNVANSESRARGAGITAACPLVVSSCRVSSNSAHGALVAWGGGIELLNQHTVISSSQLASNSVLGEDARGGAVYLQSLTGISVSSSHISRNDVKGTFYGYGGAICGAQGSSVSVSNCSVTSNTVSSLEFAAKGGGFFSIGGNLSVVSSHVCRNVLVARMQAYGGAVWGCCGATIRAVNATFSQNLLTAETVQGGAVWLSNLDTTFNAHNGTFVANEIHGGTAALGGGFYAVALSRWPPSIEFVETRFQENSVNLFQSNFAEKGGGGGACFVQANAFLKRAAIVNNSAHHGLGGGLLVMGLNTTMVVMSDSNVSFNEAQDGGGVYLASSLRFDTSILEQNSATGQGGAIFLSYGSSLNFQGQAVLNRAILGSTLFSAQDHSTSAVSLSGIILAGPGQAVLIPVARAASLRITNVSLVCAPGSFPVRIRGSFHRVEPVILDSNGSSVTKLNVTTRSTQLMTWTLRCRSCDAGTYQLMALSVDNSSRANCHPCPFGGDCQSGGSLLKSRRGFWGFRAGDSQVRFTPCPEGYCCNASSCPLSQCQGGRQGVMCGDCCHSSGNAFFSSRCVSHAKCTDAQWAIPLLLVVCVGYTAFLIVSPSSSSTGLFSVLLFFYQTLFLVRNSSEWHHASAQALAYVESIFTGSPVSAGGSTSRGVCVVPGMEAVHVIAANYILPVLITSSMGIWWVVVRLRDWLRQRKTEDPLAETDSLSPLASELAQTTGASSWGEVLRHRSLKHWTPGWLAGIRLLLLSYSNLTATSFSLMTCRRLQGADGRLVLFRQGSISCPQPWQLLPLLLLVVLTAVPGCLVEWIRRNKTHHAEVVSSVCGHFCTGSRHWVAVMLYQRWFLALVYSVVPSAVWRGLILTTACVVYVVMGLLHRPFEQSPVQRLYITSLMALVLVSLVALVGDVKASLASTESLDNNAVIDTSLALMWIQLTTALLPGAISLAWMVASYLRRNNLKSRSEAGLKSVELTRLSS